jgi:uncharacterized protein YndB with AHSA1/START domain
MTQDFGPVGNATVIPDGDAWTLIFVRELKHPPAVVWQALTDPAEIDRWAPFAADRDLAATGHATLTMIDRDTRLALPAEVLQAVPPRLLEYSWGEDRLRWELEAHGRGTTLTLRHTLAKPDMDAMVAAGWHLCLVVLDRMLGGDPVGPIRGRDAMAHGFEDLRDAYAEKFRNRTAG